MKRYNHIILLVLLIFTSFSMSGQVMISDTLFLQALIESGVDSNQDGQIQFEEAEAIVDLEIEFEDITSLSGIEAFINLEEIKIGHTLVETVDLTNNLLLTNINLADNELEAVNISDLQQLERLVVRNNTLSNIDLSGLPNLEILDAENNQLTSIDVSNLLKLEDLNLDENELSSLDLSSLSNLTDLEVVKNNLSSLDFSENSKLQRLHISDNNIDSIYVKHLKDLIVLLALRCPINTLDLAGLDNLFTLWINDSSVKRIFMKGASPDPSQLYFVGAPLEYICADQSYFPTLLDELDDQNITDCLVTSFCPYSDEGIFGGISGKAKVGQSLEDCDTSSNYIPYPKLYLEWLSPNGQDLGVLIGSEDGSYSINYYGTMTLTPALTYAPEWLHIVPEFSASNYSSNPQYYTHDFCMVPNIEMLETQINIIPLQEFRAGFESNVLLMIRNTGTLPFSGTLTLKLPLDSLTYVSSEETPSLIEQDRISWEIQDLLPFNEKNIGLTLRLNSPMDTPPLFGAEAIQLCAELTNEDQYETQSCIDDFSVNSFDPNDKTYLGKDTITISQVDDLEKLTYLIRFENTGSAEAVNIVISDALDHTFINPSSIQIIDASHSVNLEMKEDGIVNFIFSDIYLPFESGFNRGYVLFSVESRKENISVNDEIKNSAAIYFDFNYPIITNEATISIVDNPISNSHNSATFDQTGITIFPNPSAGSFTIELAEHQNRINRIEWIDMDGKTRRVDNIDSQQFILSKTNFAPGLYSLRITTDKFVQIQKVIIQ